METMHPLVEAYFNRFDAATQELHQIRSLVFSLVPAATEDLKYGIPTFIYHGNLVHYAAFKKHIGFYPVPSGMQTVPLSRSAHSITILSQYNPCTQCRQHYKGRGCFSGNQQKYGHRSGHQTAWRKTAALGKRHRCYGDQAPCNRSYTPQGNPDRPNLFQGFPDWVYKIDEQ